MHESEWFNLKDIFLNKLLIIIMMDFNTTIWNWNKVLYFGNTQVTTMDGYDVLVKPLSEIRLLQTRS